MRVGIDILVRNRGARLNGCMGFSKRLANPEQHDKQAFDEIMNFARKKLLHGQRPADEEIFRIVAAWRKNNKVH